MGEIMKLTKEELKELQNNVERIPQFEEKLGLKLENISFKCEEEGFTIFGDLYVDNMDDYDYIIINATLYDKDNNIIDSAGASILNGNFLGFKTIDIFFYHIEPKDIKKIRIYPQGSPR